ncbi:hypothetical protein LTR62_000787 [Meristemomyces frigidus]|uniref:Altered inheritance of mitochondria protein 24, mitochondrial n=1 Tax=Meristemomyces frigidus TaxID=1508187 RepID=A0AAN7YQR7_9PEZI|nr:hypothetical protein LTR62_000787 [Meristemomyces frigidus]
MRGQTLDHVCATCRFQLRSKAFVQKSSKRYVQISAAPSTPAIGDSHNNATSAVRTDARFEVLGTTSSMLSASLSASQNLYTRKGTLVGLNGKPENVVSTLSLLEPFRRAVVGIPFLYQKVSSTTPYEALIAPRNSSTSLVVVHLDGRQDWMVAQRKALLAWTGHTLSLAPRTNTKMALSHWGSTTITGRGLLALSGRGRIHQIALKADETYILHPSNVLAYNMTQNTPEPYRFKSTSFRLQVPSISGWIPDSKFWRTMRESTAWRGISGMAFRIRTWTRRGIWGDRLFLQFCGPATILIQSRGSSITDVLTDRDVNEVADSPAGAAAKSVAMIEAGPSTAGTAQSKASEPSATRVIYATVQKGNVKFDEQKV